jgi:hypothetical protein
LLDRVVNPCWVLVPTGAVLFGRYIQHETPIIMQTPPFSGNITAMLACSPKPSA